MNAKERRERIERMLIASSNPDKVEELRTLLRPLGIELLTIEAFPDVEPVVEDRPTLEENALKKARHWHERTGLPVLADDTGLEVEALGGDPGVRSARYAGEPPDNRKNMERLLEELRGASSRKARFRTVAALVTGSEEKLFEGVCTGEILQQPRGEGGFGYDPLFLPEEFGRSFAELSPEEKNRISHRGRALRKVVIDLGKRGG